MLEQRIKSIALERHHFVDSDQHIVLHGGEDQVVFFCEFNKRYFALLPGHLNDILKDLYEVIAAPVHQKQLLQV